MIDRRLAAEGKERCQKGGEQVRGVKKHLSAGPPVTARHLQGPAQANQTKALAGKLTGGSSALGLLAPLLAAAARLLADGAAGRLQETRSPAAANREPGTIVAAAGLCSRQARQLGGLSWMRGSTQQLPQLKVCQAACTACLGGAAGGAAGAIRPLLLLLALLLAAAGLQILAVLLQGRAGGRSWRKMSRNAATGQRPARAASKNTSQAA